MGFGAWGLGKNRALGLHTKTKKPGTHTFLGASGGLKKGLQRDLKKEVLKKGGP